MRNALILIVLAATISACASNSPSASSDTSASASSAAASPPASAADADLYYGSHLPAGPELTALKSNCEICHSGDMYASQRLSKVTWNAEVTKMMKFGSPLPKSEKGALVAYLAKYLGPTVPRAADVPTATAPPLSYSGPPPVQQ